MLFSTNNITIENILNSNFIKNNKYQGFYTIQVLDKSYEIEILNWYYRLTKNLPLSFTLLICNNLGGKILLIKGKLQPSFCINYYIF